MNGLSAVRDDALRARVRSLYYRVGRSQAWIARAVNRSKERVSQLLERPERHREVADHHWRRRSRMRWEAALRRLPQRPDVQSLKDLARACHMTPETTKNQLKKTGLYTEAMRQMRGHRDRAKQLVLTRRLFKLAHHLGFTPTSWDINQAGIRYDDVRRLFGSVRAFQVAAGLTPNSRGKMVATGRRVKPPGTIRPAKERASRVA